MSESRISDTEAALAALPLEELERLLAAATPGAVHTDQTRREGDKYTWVMFPDGSTLAGTSGRFRAADAEYEVVLRNAAPQMIAALRGAKEALAAKDAEWEEEYQRAEAFRVEVDAVRKRYADHLAVVNRDWSGTIERAESAEASLSSARQEIERLTRTVKELGEQLEFDRTAVAASMTAANKAIDGRHWLTEGRGPYEWDDDRWHSEFYAAALEIKAALEPLTKISANWTGCPMKGEEVAMARIDLKAEIASLKRELSEAQKDRERLDWLESEADRTRFRGDHGWWFDFRGTMFALRFWPFRGGSAYCNVRAAIDAARSEGGNTDKGRADGGTPRCTETILRWCGRRWRHCSG